SYPFCNPPRAILVLSSDQCSFRCQRGVIVGPPPDAQQKARRIARLFKPACHASFLCSFRCATTPLEYSRGVSVSYSEPIDDRLSTALSRSGRMCRRRDTSWCVCLSTAP